MSSLGKRWKLSDKTRRKLSIIRIGNKNCVGRKLSKETREKISKSRKGQPSPFKGKHHSEAIRRKLSEIAKKRGNHLPSRKGKYHSEETKKKISEANKGKHHFSIEERKRLSEMCKGEKSYNWKGGITPENLRIRHSIEFRLWSEAIFARDNWICQKCGKKGGELHAHHILNFAKYPELRFAIDNGITLCKDCHKEFHKRYGNRNNTKGQLEEFLKQAKSTNERV